MLKSYLVIAMRLRKVKDAKEIIEASEYLILNPKDYKGNFKSLFNNNNPIKIEIGMGKGDFIYNNALRYPDINFIGIEKFDSVIVRAVQKLGDNVLPNLKLIRMDALEIEEVFDKEIDTIYLNFSDPWPKNRHELRRLTSPVFLAKYDKVFKGDKRIIQKTDNRKLFEYSVMSVTNYGYKIEKLSLDLYNDEEYLKDNIPTEYETKFTSKGDRIYLGEYYKA